MKAVHVYRIHYKTSLSVVYAIWLPARTIQGLHYIESLLLKVVDLMSERPHHMVDIRNKLFIYIGTASSFLEVIWHAHCKIAADNSHIGLLYNHTKCYTKSLATYEKNWKYKNNGTYQVTTTGHNNLILFINCEIIY